MPADAGLRPRRRPMGADVRRRTRTSSTRAARRRRGLAAQQGMTRALGPICMSIWEEPGLLIEGFDHPPTIMMGHAKPEYRAWIEARGLRAGQAAADLRPRHHPGIPAARQADHRVGREEPAHPSSARSTSRSSRRRPRSSSHPERRLVGQLGLRPADPARDQGRRRQAEADRVQRPDPHRRARRQAGRVHDHAARPQRGDQAAERQPAPVRLGQAAAVAAQAQGADDAGAADGRASRNCRRRGWRASSPS